MSLHAPVVLKICCDHCDKELAPLRPEWSKTEVKLPKGHLHGHLCDECQQALKDWFEGKGASGGPRSGRVPDTSTMAAPEGMAAETSGTPAPRGTATGKGAKALKEPQPRTRPSALAAERS